MKNKGKNRRKTAASCKKPPSATTCAVCGEGDGKYKCPKCRAPFCCVQCSKDHKANQCPAGSSTAEKATKSDASVNQTSQYVPSALLNTSQIIRKRNAADDQDSDSDDHEPGWSITPDMKRRLQQSSWLRKELQDGGLRHLIGMIDASSDNETETECNKKKFLSNKRNRCSNMHEEISPRVLTLARSKNSHPKFALFIDQLLLTAGVLQPVEGGDGEGVGPLSLIPVPRRAGAGEMNHEESEESSSVASDESSDSDRSDGSEEDSCSSGEESDASDGDDGSN